MRNLVIVLLLLVGVTSCTRVKPTANSFPRVPSEDREEYFQFKPEDYPTSWEAYAVWTADRWDSIPKDTLVISRSIGKYGTSYHVKYMDEEFRILPNYGEEGFVLFKNDEGIYYTAIQYYTGEGSVKDTLLLRLGDSTWKSYQRIK